MIRIKKSEVSLNLKTEGSVDIVDIAGQLDSFAARDLKSQFQKLTDAKRYNLILNFQNVEYVDSMAIGSIVAVVLHVRVRKGDLKICGMKENIRKVFDLVGASKMLEIFKTEQEALNSFS